MEITAVLDAKGRGVLPIGPDAFVIPAVGAWWRHDRQEAALTGARP